MRRCLFLSLLTILGMAGCKHQQSSSVQPGNSEHRAQLEGELLRAAQGGETASVARLLQEGANVESSNHSGETALSVAADLGHVETARLLLAHGASPVAAKLRGDQALTEAAMGSRYARLSIVLDGDVSPGKVQEALVSMTMAAPLVISPKGERVSLPSTQPDGVSTEQTLELLIAHGAKIELRDEEGATPLFRAAQFGNDGMVRVLLDHGAKVQARNNSGDTPLIAAACECASIDMPDTLPAMQLLLRKGANVNAKNRRGSTALMAAAWAGRTENIRFLLDHGANIDARDNVGDTALLASAGAGAMSAVGVIYTVEPMKLLLARGADINARNNNGDTALTLAAATGGYEDLATVKLLLRSGADPAARNNKGDSALALATRHHRRRIAATLTAAMEK